MCTRRRGLAFSDPPINCLLPYESDVDFELECAGRDSKREHIPALPWGAKDKTVGSIEQLADVHHASKVTLEISIDINMGPYHIMIANAMAVPIMILSANFQSLQ